MSRKKFILEVLFFILISTTIIANAMEITTSGQHINNATIQKTK